MVASTLGEHLGYSIELVTTIRRAEVVTFVADRPGLFGKFIRELFQSEIAAQKVREIRLRNANKLCSLHLGKFTLFDKPA